MYGCAERFGGFLQRSLVREYDAYVECGEGEAGIILERPTEGGERLIEAAFRHQADSSTVSVVGLSGLGGARLQLADFCKEIRRLALVLGTSGQPVQSRHLIRL